MKKTSVFLIIVAFIISVVVITFFGKTIAFGQFQVYIESITITNERSNNRNMIFIDFDESKDAPSIFLECRVLPENATYKEKYKYYITGNTYEDDEGNTHVFADVNSNGEVYFLEKGMVEVYVVTTDGSALSDSVIIMCS
ncbi:MAG: hypothetical protein LUD47_01095 [Clostridia bacterium]|nr:hypothetical protein [Clostridia bacterium]